MVFSLPSCFSHFLSPFCACLCSCQGRPSRHCLHFLFRCFGQPAFARAVLRHTLPPTPQSLGATGHELMHNNKNKIPPYTMARNITKCERMQPRFIFFVSVHVAPATCFCLFFNDSEAKQMTGSCNIHVLYGAGKPPEEIAACRSRQGCHYTAGYGCCLANHIIHPLCF